jgi:hypothetical protein
VVDRSSGSSPAWNAAFPTFLTGSLIAALALI